MRGFTDAIGNLVGEELIQIQKQNPMIFKKIWRFWMVIIAKKPTKGTDFVAFRTLLGGGGGNSCKL